MQTNLGHSVQAYCHFCAPFSPILHTSLDVRLCHTMVSKRSKGVQM